MNVSEIVNAAARKIGLLAKGEQLDGEDTQNFIRELQSLLAQWATKRLYVHKAIDLEIPLTHGKQIYLVGNISGDCCEYALNCCGYVIPRPDINAEISHISEQAWIDGCCVSIARDTNNTIPCADVIYTVDAPSWSFKVSEQVNGQTLKIKAYALPFKLCSHDCLHLPPVYESALVLTLAVNMADEYGVTPSNTLLTNQATAIQFLKDSNSTPFYDNTALPVGAGYRDWWTINHG